MVKKYCIQYFYIKNWFYFDFEGCVVVIDGQKYWYRLVSVSVTDTLAFDTKYRYRYRWISNIDTRIFDFSNVFLAAKAALYLGSSLTHWDKFKAEAGFI